MKKHKVIVFIFIFIFNYNAIIYLENHLWLIW